MTTTFQPLRAILDALVLTDFGLIKGPEQFSLLIDSQIELPPTGSPVFLLWLDLTPFGLQVISPEEQWLKNSK